MAGWKPFAGSPSQYRPTVLLLSTFVAAEKLFVIFHNENQMAIIPVLRRTIISSRPLRNPVRQFATAAHEGGSEQNQYSSSKEIGNPISM